MSRTVDDRVVKLSFDNAQFGSAIGKTLADLAALQKSLEFQGSDKGMRNLESAAGRFNMGGLGATIDGVSARFLAMSTVAITALATITSKAIATGTQLVKSLTSDPISSGLHEYETNLNSIQTVLANTAAAGTTLKDVNTALAQLNEYSDKTIYNFGQMAKNIGTFTAAGVDLDTSVAAIKGISNLAALSGSNAEQASGAMYQLSQALSAGRVSLQDWNSVVNAGMGGAVFQRALAQTAEKMGTLDAGAVKLTGKMKNATINGQSFRESITAKPGEESWLTSKVLTETLQQFTGDLTNAQLKAKGFNDQQIKAIQQTAKNALAAATEVKTLGGVFDVAKETVGSGWSQSFQLIFGDFEQAKKTFTGLSNYVNGIINKQADNRNKILGEWKKLGGRDVFIEGLKQGVQALGDVIAPIQKAFRDIFPAKTGKDLYELTVRFRDFMSSLKLNEGTMDNLRRTFRGLFAVIDIVKQVVFGLFGVIGDLFGAMGNGNGSVLKITGSLGDWLVKLDMAIKNGEGLKKFFSGLSKVLQAPIKLIGAITGAIASLFTPETADKARRVEDAIGGVADRLNPLDGLLGKLNKAWRVFLDGLGKVGELVGKVGDKIGGVLDGIGGAISDNMSGENFDRVLDTINTVLLGGITVMLAKFFKGGIGVDVGGGMLEKLGGLFDGLTGNLKAMQQQVQAKTLLMIAGAIAILTASVVVLSLIDSKKLATSLGAMTAAFAQLLIGMAIVVKMAGGAGFVKVPLVAASMILLATAILILSAAIKVMSSMSWDEMLRGLAGVAAALTILTLGVLAMNKAGGPMLRAAASILILSIALNAMAGALKLMSMLSWAEMGKGLAGVAGSLVVLAAAMRLMPKGMLLQAAALVAVGAALNLIAGALKIMASMSWVDIAQGLVALGGSLLILAIGLTAMSGAIPGAIALGIAAGGLMILAPALKLLGLLKWEEIGKGLAAIAGSLLIFAIGLTAMSAALPGAAALVVAAGGLAILTPVLIALGKMSWEEILKGLAGLAGVFIILGLAGLVLTPLVPVLLGLGAAIALIGVGVALAGVGVLAFVTALTALVAIGTAGIAILSTLLVAIIKLIPQLLASFAQGLVELAVVIGNGAPKIVKAIEKILVALLDMVVRMVPKIVKTFGVLLDGFLKLIVTSIPKIAEAGLKLIIGFLKVIADKLPAVIEAAANVIIAFLKGLGEQLPRIVDQAAKTIIAFLNGITQAIQDNDDEFIDAGYDMIGALVEGLLKGLAEAPQRLAGAVGNLAGSVLGGLKSGFGIFSPSKKTMEMGKLLVAGLIVGLKSNQDKLKAGLSTFNEALKKVMDDSKTDIEKYKSRLEDLSNTKRTKANSAKLDKDIRETTKALKEATAEYGRASAARKVFSKDLADERAKLIKLQGQYDIVSEKLKNAQSILADAKKTRDDFATQTKQQFSVLPAIDESTTLDTYSDAIRAQTTANQKYKATLDALRKLGLDDATYRKFLDEGVTAQPFLDQLLASGKSGVDEIDKITAQLDTSASALGNKAARELYQAGVNAAQGLVDGLAKQQATLQKQMESLAKTMVTAIKKELGIKSPSTVFAEVAKFSADGLVGGFKKYGPIVAEAARGIGDEAFNAVKNTMSRISDAISGDLDMTPIIAPVLDLTSVKAEALGLNDILAPREISAKVSYDQASLLSLQTQAAQDARDELAELQMVAGDTFEYTQINNSPKALSEAEIYRQTKNQLSTVKGALPK